MGVPDSGGWWVVAVPDPPTQEYFDGGICWVIGLFTTEDVAEQWRDEHEPNGTVLPLAPANGPRPKGRGLIGGG